MLRSREMSQTTPEMKTGEPNRTQIKALSEISNKSMECTYTTYPGVCLVP